MTDLSPLTPRPAPRLAALLALLGVLWLCMACDDRRLLDTYQHVDVQGWARTDTLCFPLPPAPHTGRYDVQLGMRYGNGFPYSDIAIVTEVTVGRRTEVDTLRFAMADSLGHPLGRGMGLLHRSMPLPPLHLRRGQRATVTLRHIMYREVLPAICDVGVQVTAADRQ